MDAEIGYRTEKYEIAVKRPQAVETLLKYFSVIDVHDHLRQGSLALEVHWKTLTWWHRMFRTILGMIVTNAYKAYCFEMNRIDITQSSPEDFNTFIGKLTHQLIYNDYFISVATTRDSLSPTDSKEFKASTTCFYLKSNIYNFLQG